MTEPRFTVERYTIVTLPNYWFVVVRDGGEKVGELAFYSPTSADAFERMVKDYGAMREALEEIAEEKDTPGPGHAYAVKSRIKCAEIARKALGGEG